MIVYVTSNPPLFHLIPAPQKKSVYWPTVTILTGA